MTSSSITSDCAAQLVHDLAGLLGGRGLGAGALQPREHAQSVAGEPSAERQHHAGRPERVATEEGEEPGGAGGQELLIGMPDHGQPQRVEVGQRALDPSGEPRVDAIEGEPRLGRRAPRRGAGRTAHRADRICRVQLPPHAHRAARRYDDVGAQQQAARALGEAQARGREARRHVLARPAGGAVVELHGDRGGGGQTLLEGVDGCGVEVELDLDGGGDRCVVPGRERERLGASFDDDLPVDAQAHAGVGGRVVEVAQQRLDRDPIGCAPARHEVLGCEPADAHPKAAHHAHIGVRDAVNRRGADRAVGGRPHLGGGAQHDELVVQEGLQGVGHESSRTTMRPVSTRIARSSSRLAIATAMRWASGCAGSGCAGSACAGSACRGSGSTAQS